MAQEIIQYIGVHDLNEEEQEVVKQLAVEYQDKIKTLLQNLTTLVVHVKTHDTEGSRKRFDITVRVEAPTGIIESNDEEWDLAVTLHKVFKAVEHQIEHKLKVSNNDLHM